MRDSRGFTLIEVVVSLGLLSFMAGILWSSYAFVVPSLQAMSERTYLSEAKDCIRHYIDQSEEMDLDSTFYASRDTARASLWSCSESNELDSNSLGYWFTLRRYPDMKIHPSLSAKSEGITVAIYEHSHYSESSIPVDTFLWIVANEAPSKK